MEKSDAKRIFNGVDLNNPKDINKKYQELKLPLEKRLENTKSLKEKESIVKSLNDLEEAYKNLSEKNIHHNEVNSGGYDKLLWFSVLSIIALISGLFSLFTNEESGSEEATRITGGSPSEYVPDLSISVKDIDMIWPDKTFENYIEDEHGLFMDMVAIKTGKFKVGLDYVTYTDSNEKLLPPNEFRLLDFYIGRFEVSSQQFKRFLDSTNYGSYDTTIGYQKAHQKRSVESAIDSLYPAVNVSRNDALAFCQYLREKTGMGYRLPTEAEWEYAAKAGIFIDDSANNNSHIMDIDSLAWYYDNSDGKLHKSGQKMANQFGLYDMTGNAWEWCHDDCSVGFRQTIMDYKSYYELQSDDIGVVRGGSFLSEEQECRVTSRKTICPESRKATVGFRVARFYLHGNYSKRKIPAESMDLQPYEQQNQ